MKKLLLLFLILPLFSNAITPITTCGFECGVFTSGSTYHLQALITGTSTTTVRSGVRSLRYNGINDGTSEQEHTNIFSASSVWVGRCYVYFGTLPNQNSALMVFQVGGGNSPGAYFSTSDNKIYCGDAFTLGSTGISVTTGQWYRLDVRFNAGVIDVQVNGTSCSQLSVTNESPTIVAFGSSSLTCVGEMFFDDFIASNTSGDYPIGAGNVYQFIPGNPDGTHNVAGANDFERSATGTDITNSTTDAYVLIGKEPLPGSAGTYINLIAPPNATDYVECVFRPGTGVSTPTSAPRAVEAFIVFGKGTGTGTNNLRIAINDNGTLDNMFNADVGGTSPNITYVRKQYLTAPTGGAWTVTSGAGNFNNLRVRCFTSDAAPDPWFIATMIEAEFAPASALPRRVLSITKK